MLRPERGLGKALILYPQGTLSAGRKIGTHTVLVEEMD